MSRRYSTNTTESNIYSDIDIPSNLLDTENLFEEQWGGAVSKSDKMLRSAGFNLGRAGHIFNRARSSTTADEDSINIWKFNESYVGSKVTIEDFIDMHDPNETALDPTFKTNTVNLTLEIDYSKVLRLKKRSYLHAVRVAIPNVQGQVLHVKKEGKMIKGATKPDIAYIQRVMGGGDKISVLDSIGNEDNDAHVKIRKKWENFESLLNYLLTLDDTTFVVNQPNQKDNTSAVIAKAIIDLTRKKEDEEKKRKRAAKDKEKAIRLGAKDVEEAASNAAGAVRIANERDQASQKKQLQDGTVGKVKGDVIGIIDDEISKLSSDIKVSDGNDINEELISRIETLTTIDRDEILKKKSLWIKERFDEIQKVFPDFVKPDVTDKCLSRELTYQAQMDSIAASVDKHLTNLEDNLKAISINDRLEKMKHIVRLKEERHNVDGSDSSNIQDILEVIIVDNLLGDKTPEILQKYKQLEELKLERDRKLEARRKRLLRKMKPVLSGADGGGAGRRLSGATAATTAAARRLSRSGNELSLTEEGGDESGEDVLDDSLTRGRSSTAIDLPKSPVYGEGGDATDEKAVRKGSVAEFVGSEGSSRKDTYQQGGYRSSKSYSKYSRRRYTLG